MSNPSDTGKLLIEIDAPLAIAKNIMDAMGMLQPEGPARILLADALAAANNMVAWFRELQDRDVRVWPSWTAFVHSNGRRVDKEKEEVGDGS